MNEFRGIHQLELPKTLHWRENWHIGGVIIDFATTNDREYFRFTTPSGEVFYTYRAFR